MWSDHDTYPIPVVSVIMAVRNGEKYLRQAVNSILQQTFTDFEFIIINDCSTDRSDQILEEYVDPRLKIYSDNEHMGLTRSLNRALGYARGKYIARMDADDVCLPSRFEVQVNFLEAHPKVSVLGTGVTLIDRDGAVIRDVHFPTEHDLIRWHLAFYNPIAHPTVMMRRFEVEEVGGYDASLVRSQDYELWWRLSLVSELANLDDVCLLLRQHPEQVTNTFPGGHFELGIKINQRYLSKLLGKRISEDTIKKLWSNDFVNFDDAISASQLILLYFNRISQDIKSKQLRQCVTQDLIFKMIPITNPFSGKLRFWLLSWQVLSLNPIILVKFLIYRRFAKIKEVQNKTH